MHIHVFICLCLCAFIGTVAKQLAEDQELGLKRFDFVEINAMALTSPEHAYSLIWDVVGTKVSPSFLCARVKDRSLA
jgi:Cdc6-like AAA superfamily ATPase